jgi:hypothetical protein
MPKQDPVVRLGQGDYTRDYYFEDPPRPNESGSIGWILIAVVIIAGCVVAGIIA